MDQDTRNLVSSVEQLAKGAAAHDSGFDVAGGRKELREIILCGTAKEGTRKLTLVESINYLASNAVDPQQARIAAIFLVRFASIPNFLPRASNTSRVDASLSDLVTRALPDLVKDRGINPKDQTYEIMKLLERIHPWVCEQLSVLKIDSSLVAVLSARQRIQRVLNHGPLKGYLAPYGIKDVSSSLDSVYKCVTDVDSSVDSLFHTRISEALSIVEQELQVSNMADVFLYSEYYVPFLKAVHAAITEEIESAKDRLASTISLRADASLVLEKKYPLGQTGQLIRIPITLLNKGPGFAQNVRGLVSTPTRGLRVVNDEFTLGDIPASQFVLSIDIQAEEPLTAADIYKHYRARKIRL